MTKKDLEAKAIEIAEEYVGPYDKTNVIHIQMKHACRKGAFMMRDACAKIPISITPVRHGSDAETVLNACYERIKSLGEAQEDG